MADAADQSGLTGTGWVRIGKTVKISA